MKQIKIEAMYEGIHPSIPCLMIKPFSILSDDETISNSDPSEILAQKINKKIHELVGKNVPRKTDNINGIYIKVTLEMIES